MSIVKKLKLAVFAFCCICTTACVNEYGYIGHVEPRLESFTSDFEKYFVGKDIEYTFSAFYGNYFDRPSIRKAEGGSLRKLVFFMDDLDKIAFFRGYGKCGLMVSMDKDYKVLGLLATTDFRIRADCLDVVPVMNHFKQIYREGMTPKEIATSMDSFLDERANQIALQKQAQQDRIDSENRARAYQEEQDRLILSSQQGVGLRVYNKASPYITGFVDAVANGKIRIILPNNQVIWDYAENWLIYR